MPRVSSRQKSGVFWMLIAAMITARTVAIVKADMIRYLPYHPIVCSHQIVAWPEMTATRIRDHW